MPGLFRCAKASLTIRALMLVTLGLQAQAVAQTGAPTGPRRPATPILASSLRGAVTLLGTGAPVAGARVTLFTTSLSFFRETRSAADGSFSLASVASGTLRLGVAARGRDYDERSVTLVAGVNRTDVALMSETEPGRWEVIGNTLPETLDATDIGVLRPDGTIFYCHDTTDPIVFDPRTGQKSFPPPSGSAQGCMNGTLLEDGSVLLVGGQDGASPGDFRNAIPWVKLYCPNDTWVQLADMNQAAGRWYPGLARLNDGRVIVMGGGTAPDATRSDTCELFDLASETWSYTGSMGNPVEFPPSALLHTGDVLQTWAGRPQLYDVAAGTWSDTGQFVGAARGYPGHSDHSLIVLSDGRAAAVGVRRLDQPNAAMTEYYDPATGQWSAGTSPSLTRMQAEVVYLPDGNILVAGGDKETTQGSEPNVLGIVRRCDLLEPQSGAWRRVADMAEFREYHAVTLLLPDGRITTTGGTYIKFQVGPTSPDIEAYRPPYLFRGVRPELSSPSSTTPARGATVTFQVFPRTKLTSVVLMGMQSTTHWVDAGIPRRIELNVAQVGTQASVTLPSDANQLPLGWYLLFGMVDDIPSVALVVRVDA